MKPAPTAGAETKREGDETTNNTRDHCPSDRQLE